MPLTSTHTTAPDASFSGTGSNAWVAPHGLEMESGFLVGRFSALTGPPENITVGTNLSVTGGTLNAAVPASIAAVVGVAPLLAAGTSTSTVSLNTSGVIAGTYGAANLIPRFDVSAQGILQSADIAGTLGTYAAATSLSVVGAVSGTSTTGTLTVAYTGTRVAVGDVLGTSTTGTLTTALSTTGVTAGTYGTSTIWPQVIVDAKGRLTGAGPGGTLGPFASFTSLVAAGYVTGTSTTGTLTTAYAGTLVGAGDILGTSTTGTFTAALSTTGVTAGTFGTGGTMVSQVTVDAKGRVTAISNVGISFPPAGGTMTIVGDVLGTNVTGTLTAALSTTGVTAGTYGTGGTMVPQVTVDAKGRITAVSNVGITFPPAGGTMTIVGAVLGTNLTGTLTAALSTTGITAGAFGGVAGVPRFDIGADGRITTGLNVVLQATSPIIHSTSGTGTLAWSLSTTGITTGLPGTTVLTFEGVDAWGRGTSVGTISNYAITGTATMGGVISTRGVQAAIGSSGSRSYAMLAPYVDATPVSLTTVAGTLMQYSLPASALAGSGQGIRFSMWGTHQAGLANARRFALAFGTATVQVATGTAATAGQWQWEGSILGQAAAQQQYISRFSVFGSNAAPTEQVAVGTLGMNLSTVTTLCIVGTGTTASAIRAQHGMFVEFLGLQ